VSFPHVPNGNGCFAIRTSDSAPTRFRTNQRQAQRSRSGPTHHGARHLALRSTRLQPLLEPHKAIDRKRVTILYKVLDPGLAARIVEADIRSSTFRVNSTDRPTARLQNDQQAAQKTAGRSSRRVMPSTDSLGSTRATGMSGS
jgi:hypothetical protein